MTYQEKARKYLMQWLDKLNDMETQEFILLSDRWDVVSHSLESLIETLAGKEVKSLNELYKLAEYKEFLVVSKSQSNLYNNYAAGIIEKYQKVYAKAAIESTQGQIDFITTRYHRINIDAVSNWIGQSSDGSPIAKILARNYGDSVDKIENILLESTAIGRNPRATARLMTQASNELHWKSLRVARTEQMNIYRNTSLLQMQESGVVKSWQRIEQSDAPDDFCQSENGKIYPLDVGFESHPNCRGALIPVVQ